MVMMISIVPMIMGTIAMSTHVATILLVVIVLVVIVLIAIKHHLHCLKSYPSNTLAQFTLMYCCNHATAIYYLHCTETMHRRCT